VNVVIGYYAGQFVQLREKNYESVAKLLLVGGGLILAALCWNMVFPINKKLWTSSFVLLTTGIDLAIMAALIFIIEIRKWTDSRWTQFFVIPGKNPLFIYLLSELLVISLYMIPVASGGNLFSWINRNLFQKLVPGAVGSLLFAISFMLVCWSVGWLLDRKKIYVRV
ncbi:MAG: rane protein, partial [Spirosoma sp.]|nr:rane protein [Spirosoma sp.]